MKQGQNRVHGLANENAMTEIALALAMGFFAIMILTLVSLSSGQAPSTKPAQKSISAAALHLKPPTKAGHATHATKVTEKDLLLLHYQGQFFDRNLVSITDAQLANELIQLDQTDGQLVVALSPDLSIEEAIRIQDKFADRALSLTSLNEAWLAQLATLTPQLDPAALKGR